MKRFISFLLVAVLAIAIVAPLHSASALSGSQFQAGRIIDDGVFYNASAMNAAQVQAFLNAKVPTCDTYGTQIYSGSTTRAQFSATKGYAPPFTCLKDYSQTTPAMAADAYCSAVPAGTFTSAQIIVAVAQACSINPEILLVLLQKEQALVTDTWPWPYEYQEATGYGCPDTSSCNASFAGFFNQVYYGARQYQMYAKKASSYSYQADRVNNIQYNPSTACGASSVYLSDQATTSLYNYTPYQPNAAALNNLNGTGDSCSAYGNRNFWVTFNNWFGSPYANCAYPSSDGTQVFRLFNPNTNSYLLTSDPLEVCSASASYNFQLDDTLFTSSASTTGAPIYRLARNGNYFYTASSAEAVSAANNYGYSLNGIGFYASTTPTTAAPLPLYRLSYGPTGAYFYTVSASERDAAVSIGFTYEGIDFYVGNTLGNSLSGVDRLSSPQAGYLYTADVGEQQSAVLGYGFSDEGNAFNARLGFTADDVPVYRLSGPHGYLFTTSFSERKLALLMGYQSQGIGFYAYPSTFQGATVPVYRLVNKTGTYLYTTSSTEINSAVTNYGYTLEGMAFRLP